MSQFASQLGELKQKIDEDIAEQCSVFISETEKAHGEYPAEAVKAYCELLSRGGKRIRGALTIVSYKMFGGQDQELALEAAQAIEMLHAYILMVDDIQDRSEVRRGGPSAHVRLADYHKANKLEQDSDHFGISLAMNGFLFGSHKAINVLANLKVDPELRLKLIELVNNNFVITLHGQSLDIFSEVTSSTTEDHVDAVLLHKTAHYTFMNPLHVGALLAGASKSDIDILREYSLHAGRIFQITDDIISSFSPQDESGKSPMGDMIEGKRTLLVVKALELASEADSNYLKSILGKRDLAEEEFQRALNIISQSGALDYAKQQVSMSAEKALKVLEGAPDSWQKDQLAFLQDLVTQLTTRTS